MDALWVGTATVVLKLGPFTILTDPALNVTPTSRYSAGFGLHYRRTEAPAIPPEGLGPVDLVLLSHDEHGDNLDEAGRALLPTAAEVLTTEAGARRLGGNAVGLAPWASTTIEKDGARLRVTAVPARHGPPGSRPVVGPVVGFVVELGDTVIYLSGDTVHTRAVDAIGERFDVDGAFLNVGRAAFPILGPVTMGGRGAAKIVAALDPAWVAPVHCQGWSHFSETPAQTQARLDRAGVGDRVRWLPRGSWTTL